MSIPAPAPPGRCSTRDHGRIVAAHRVIGVGDAGHARLRRQRRDVRALLAVLERLRQVDDQQRRRVESGPRPASRTPVCHPHRQRDARQASSPQPLTARSTRAAPACCRRFACSRRPASTWLGQHANRHPRRIRPPSARRAPQPMHQRRADIARARTTPSSLRFHQLGRKAATPATPAASPKRRRHAPRRPLPRRGSAARYCGTPAPIISRIATSRCRCNTRTVARSM